MALYSVMMGGGKKDISEIFTNDKALQIFEIDVDASVNTTVRL